MILLFRSISSQVCRRFTVAGAYDYLLGLYSFGMFTKINTRDKLVLIALYHQLSTTIKMRFSSIGIRAQHNQ